MNNHHNHEPQGIYRRLRLTALLAGVALAPLALMQPAQAQEIDEEEEAEARPAVRSTQVEEIVVTARRREESLKDVPASITAFTGERLFETGALDITAINDKVPNVTLEVSRSTNNTLTPFIRGVGQQDPVAGFEQGIGIYLDDVYLARPQGSVLEIYEVDRIEVLRGPQGTLYGRNTIGGAIKYVTRRIGDEPSARVTLRGGTFRQRDAILSADLPITDQFKVGASVASFNRSGFGDNLNNPGRENYNKDIVAARASIEWMPSPDLFFRLSGDFIQDDSDPRQGHREVPGFQFPTLLDNVYDTRAGLEGQQDFKQYGFALNAEWDINNSFVAKSITSYRADDSFLLEDFDSLPVADIDVPAAFDNEQFTQELQLHYSGNRLAGVAGFFYMNANAFNEFDVILATLQPIIGIPITAYTLGDFETDTWSLFGDLSYDLTDTIEISGGIRFTSDKRTGRIFRQNFISAVGSGLLDREQPPGVIIPLAPSTDFLGSETFDQFTGRASISWQPTPDLHLYASYSQGFKGGSFDPRGNATLTPDFNRDGQITDDEIKEFLLFDPEEVDTFEVGSKSTFMNGRLSANLAVFYTDYTDVQIPTSVGVDTNGDGINDNFAGLTTNAGEAELIGVEFEGQAILTENLSVTGSVGWIDADFKEFIFQGENVADERVFQNTPEWTANLALTYRAPLTIYGYDGEFSAIGSASYRGDTNQFEIPSPLIDTDAYALLNLSLLWTSSSGFITLGLHGKNLTDAQYRVAGFNFPSILSGQPGALGVEGAVTSFFGDPRTVMGSVTFNF